MDGMQVVEPCGRCIQRTLVSCRYFSYTSQMLCQWCMLLEMYSKRWFQWIINTAQFIVTCFRNTDSKSDWRFIINIWENNPLFFMKPLFWPMLSSIGPLGTYLGDIWIKIQEFPLRKMNCKKLSVAILSRPQSENTCLLRRNQRCNM